MKRVTVPYFSKGMKYFTPVPVGGAAYLIFIGHPIWAGILILLAVMILTTQYVTEIDPDKKEYRDYFSFLSFNLDEEKSSFTTIDKIIITKENHSHMLNSRSRSRQLDWSMFTASLVLDGDKKLDLLTRNERADLLKEVKGFAEALKTEVEDQTTSEHFPIDVSKL
jgi:hypothetical protein